MTSVSARLFNSGERTVPLRMSCAGAYSDVRADKHGLKLNRVLADLKAVMAGSLIPATRLATRELRAEFVLNDLFLFDATSQNFTRLRGWLDFYDARSEVRVASAEVIVISA
ncbi:hypothetical protein C1J03_17585 [Sulfitobacter sp. SK012]|uniref:hypothetical protein n=1 Tax=Sulfitobacter sp. SK012 TaxID=1389005 RepID=UPI000E0BB0F6|nr:hypothetical protein [Sulfitobacter sp. SK012]AXI47658.1 hypothetical protein C1J03_17585 [Sulfitobacter sp. SK012]